MSFDEIFVGLEERAAVAIQAEQGDFILDGLLHCGKCKTPKQCRVDFLGTIRTPMCLCKCRMEQLAAEEAERKRLEYLEYIKENRRICFPEDKLKTWTFDIDDNANPKISTAMRNYVENFEKFKGSGKGLLLYGDTGRGKTFHAACVANALLDKGYRVLMTNFKRIENTVGGMFAGKQEYLDSLNRFPLLILDDLAAERKTEYMAEIVYNVIDARYRAGLPLIVTSNLTGEELQSAADMQYKRAFSRLYEMCVPVKVEGKDRRAEKLKADIAPMKELLGL